MKFYVGIFWSLILFAFVSVGFDYPVVAEHNQNYHLFKIGRSRDANEIMYDLNLDETGVPDKSNPISIYWVKKTEDNRVKPLTWIQNRFAYGLKVLDSETSLTGDNINGSYDFQFVSYNKRNFTLKKDENNQYKVFSLIEGKEILVNRIFIQIDGGGFWRPTISSVKLYGFEVQTGIKIVETIHP